MKILIVDDEKISRKILVKQLGNLGECVAIDNSSQALALFDRALQEKVPFDLITLDVSMPGMDGRQVLEFIRKKERKLKISKPGQVKIIMVSARMNISTIKACIKQGCNGYLSKPITRFQLLENLGKLGFEIPESLRETDKNTHTRVVAQIIQRFYKGQISLPVFPSIVQEVQDLLKGKEPSMEELKKIVEKDIVISSKLISIANSVLYRGLDRAESLGEALLRLGMKATQGVISTVAARNLFNSKDKSLAAVLEKLWMHSFATACIGKMLGQELGMENLENIFLKGIVHDIGKILLMKAYADTCPDKPVDDEGFQAVVHEIHTTFGSALLRQLRFSKPFFQICEFHHWNEYCSDTDPDLMIINLADHLTHKIGFGFVDFEDHHSGGSPDAVSDGKQEKNPGAETMPKFFDIASLSSLKHLGLDPDRALEISRTVEKIIHESSSIF